MVERNWFGRLTDANPDAPPAGDEDVSWADTDTLASLLAEYDRACALSRKAAAGYALDDVVAHPDLPQMSLRWIYIHMIEETARHVGHADIMRELTDGATGALG